MSTYGAPDEIDRAALQAEIQAERIYMRSLAAHPDCRDPDHPGCRRCTDIDHDEPSSYD